MLKRLHQTAQSTQQLVHDLVRGHGEAALNIGLVAGAGAGQIGKEVSGIGLLSLL
jgi:hypothetical protein